MTESKICTCPSGDGSLVHPCPAHPAVEQAGGDELEKFLAWANKEYEVEEGYELNESNTSVLENKKGWMARAALAQPSPAQAEQHWPKLEKPAQVGAIRFRAGLSSRLVVEAAQRLYEFESTPEKEAERIERLQAFREQCFEPLGAEFSKVLSENLVELSSDAKPEQADEKPGDSILCYGCFAKGVGPDHFDEAGKCLAAQGEQAEPKSGLEGWRDAIRQLADPDPLNLAPHAEAFNEAPAEALRPEQAEAERPEAAEVAFVLRNIGAMDAEDIDGDNVDLRFEDAEGRDTGCDVSIVEYAEKAADLFEQHDRIVGELRADRDSWAEQAEQRLADWDEMRKERDAALARVSGLRSLLNPILCYVENDIERMRGDRDKSDNKEIYDLAISLAMERLKAAQHAVFTTEPGCDTAVELASHITAQAQHSVPEEFIGRLSEFLAQRGATGKALLRELRTVLAAAPGKEGL
ncbi:hypothetical protein VZ232_08905 [Pseudomonas aeruginosa]|uniref:hypothetical protein n=2 Tax=Pseudomonas aeruginosa TaxID=287 RepID=UPI0021E1AB0F|nr:hypothetical protein [Pseudomonas aeruginosa]MCV0190195.1 hypothetical protein [Pseudomonas aeruginosa]MED6063396.1 hypothetical protein [Pseudomonas aeruginosa]